MVQIPAPQSAKAVEQKFNFKERETMLDDRKRALLDNASYEGVKKAIEDGPGGSAMREIFLKNDEVDDDMLRATFRVVMSLRTMCDDDLSLQIAKVQTDMFYDRLFDDWKQEFRGEKTGADEAMDFAESLLRRSNDADA